MEPIMDMAEFKEAFSPDEISRRNSIGRTAVFAEIKAGRLEARKVGRRTIITREAEKAWHNSLPCAKTIGA
jgi:hypothetical protein